MAELLHHIAKFGALIDQQRRCGVPEIVVAPRPDPAPLSLPVKLVVNRREVRGRLSRPVNPRSHSLTQSLAPRPASRIGVRAFPRAKREI